MLTLNVACSVGKYYLCQALKTSKKVKILDYKINKNLDEKFPK